MPGTKTGALHAAETNKKRDPDHYRRLGQKGGKAKVAKGYSMADPETRIELGRQGGLTGGKK